MICKVRIKLGGRTNLRRPLQTIYSIMEKLVQASVLLLLLLKHGHNRLHEAGATSSLCVGG
jgi:hypothetical protein